MPWASTSLTLVPPDQWGARMVAEVAMTRQEVKFIYEDQRSLRASKTKGYESWRVSWGWPRSLVPKFDTPR